MDYISSNKQAWEEAFDNRSESWGKNIGYRLKNEEFPFIEKDLANELTNYDFKNTTIAQFCCNNGRELLSLMKFGASYGVGFDIAENMIDFANDTAKELGFNCRFVAANILEIDDAYHNSFDYIFVTIGALIWFQDLSMFFEKASLSLKKGGKLIINEMHPVTNLFATCEEEIYNETFPNKIVYSYFRDEPWISNSGMSYIAGRNYKSKTFYDYAHTFSHIVNSICQNGMSVSKLIEFDYDSTGGFRKLNNTGIPLSYILVCQKSLFEHCI